MGEPGAWKTWLQVIATIIAIPLVIGFLDFLLKLLKAGRF